MGEYPDWYNYNYGEDNTSNRYDDDDDFDPFEDVEREREEEKWAFESVPKHGVYAHAYKKELDNHKIRELRKKGYTYRQIAEQLKCSPSTVRNRLKKLGEG